MQDFTEAFSAELSQILTLLISTLTEEEKEKVDTIIRKISEDFQGEKNKYLYTAFLYLIEVITNESLRPHLQKEIMKGSTN